MPAAAFQMTDVRFDRADQQRLLAGAVRAEDGPEGDHLDGIAQSRARPVGFDVADLGRLQRPRCRVPRRITSCCESPFGTVSPLLWPS